MARCGRSACVVGVSSNFSFFQPLHLFALANVLEALPDIADTALGKALSSHRASGRNAFRRLTWTHHHPAALVRGLACEHVPVAEAPFEPVAQVVTNVAKVGGHAQVCLVQGACESRSQSLRTATHPRKKKKAVPDLLSASCNGSRRARPNREPRSSQFGRATSTETPLSLRLAIEDCPVMVVSRCDIHYSKLPRG